MKKKLTAVALIVALLAVAVIGGTLAYFTDVTDEVNNTFVMGKVDIDLDEAKVEPGEDGKPAPTDTRVKTNDYSDWKMVPGLVYPKDPTIHVTADSEESYLFLDMNLNKFNSLLWVMAADASADTSIDYTIFEDGKVRDNLQNEAGQFSTEAFMRELAANKTVAQAIINKWFTGINHADWAFMVEPFSADDGNTLTLRFGYIGALGTKVAGKDIKFMDSFQMPSTVTQEMIAKGTAPIEKGGGNQQNAFSGTLNMNFTAYAIEAAAFDSDITDPTVVEADLLKAYAAMFPAA